MEPLFYNKRTMTPEHARGISPDSKKTSYNVSDS